MKRSKWKVRTLLLKMVEKHAYIHIYIHVDIHIHTYIAYLHEPVEVEGEDALVEDGREALAHHRP
jgi:hypothetical protein